MKTQLEKEQAILAQLISKWCDPQFSVDLATGNADRNLEHDIKKQKALITDLELELYSSDVAVRVNPITLEHKK